MEPALPRHQRQAICFGPLPTQSLHAEVPHGEPTVSMLASPQNQDLGHHMFVDAPGPRET